MKGLFIPEITAEVFRNGCLESIEALMAEGEIYDIEYEPEQQKGEWIRKVDEQCYWYECSECGHLPPKDTFKQEWLSHFCPNCGASMVRGEEDD